MLKRLLIRFYKFIYRDYIWIKLRKYCANVIKDLHINDIIKVNSDIKEYEDKQKYRFIIEKSKLSLYLSNYLENNGGINGYYTM